MGKRELVALLYLSSWCLVMVERLFLTVPWGCLWFVIVVFPDHITYNFGARNPQQAIAEEIYLLTLFFMNADAELHPL